MWTFVVLRSAVGTFGARMGPEYGTIHIYLDTQMRMCHTNAVISTICIFDVIVWDGNRLMKRDKRAPRRENGEVCSVVPQFWRNPV